MNIDNANGRAWARGTLIATLTISVVANVTHAVLAASEISLWLRVPGAAVWPVLSFLAIEIIVRIVWRSTLAHYLARAFVLGPAVPAVIVSYEHQHALLILMGENPLVSAIGPIAIDGLMIGCTLALLFTRANIASAAGTASDLQALDVDDADRPLLAEPAEVGQQQDPAPVSLIASEPATELPSAPASMPRDRSAAMIAAAALQDGDDVATAAEKSGLSKVAVRKYGQVVRLLREDPRTPVDTRRLGVRSEVVDSIRAWARLESTR